MACAFGAATAPDKVEQFINAAFEVLGDGITIALHHYFHFAHEFVRRGRLILDNKGQIRASDASINISSEDLGASLSRRGLDPDLTKAFADHLFDVLTKALSVLPRGSSLSLDRPCKYNYPSGPPEPLARDYIVNMLLHFTDPGTPYGDRFRTQKFDISIHGRFVRHANATAPLLRKGQKAPRLCLAFIVHRNLLRFG